MGAIWNSFTSSLTVGFSDRLANDSPNVRRDVGLDIRIGIVGIFEQEQQLPIPDNGWSGPDAKLSLV